MQETIPWDCVWAECTKAFREMHVLTVRISINTVKNPNEIF